ncbi:uncharacterized protein LOC116203854 [Punica granatum]|uniref:Translation initiation factor IF-1, chloroplastic n=1 Tax=Punica granatum TaxID=22663 RepID=A0A218XIW1_PUNGR|nr:uncharacterized protein LOC116203854 [Punica granatum]OWM84877.1 hypothetical protein CDL15_Pgr027664 [Punica granatum]
MSISLFAPKTPYPCPQLPSTATASKPLQLPSPALQPQTLHCPPTFLRRPIATRHVAALCARKASQGMKEQKWTHEGVIVESLPNGMFRVRLDNEDVILGYISGKIRKNFIRMLPGDKVKIEVSRYDSTRGRIIYRLRNKDSGD